MATILSGVTLNSTTDGATFATASFTPAAGDLLVVVVNVSAAGTAPTLTTNKAGETFTLVETTALGTSTSEIRLYIANQLTTAVARTITHAQTGVATGCYIQVLRVAGMTRFGLAAIRQKAETLNAAVNARLTMTLPAAALTGNAVVASVINSGTAPTPPTGWTAIGSVSRATPTVRSACWAINSGFTGTLVQNETTQNSPTTSSGVAFELDSSALPITFTSLTTDALSPSTFGPFATAVITPAANTLTLACINFNYSASSGPTAYNLSVTGCGLTWVQVARQNYFGSDADPNSNAALFRAVGPAPTTGSLSINSGAPVGMDGVSWAIVSVPGANVSNGGANAIVQAVFSATDGGTSLPSKAVTLAAFASVNNATFAMVATTLSTSPLTVTPTTGMTELGDVSSAWNAMETHYQNGNRTSLTGTPSLDALISLLGVEINAASAPASTLIESTAASAGAGAATGSSGRLTPATGAARGFAEATPYTALWSWNESAFATAPARQDLVTFASSRGITTIYQNAQGGIVSNQAGLTALLDLAAGSGIGIEFLFGDANWTYTANHQQAVDLVNASNVYIAGLTNKPTGYHFDVEPHTLGAAWATDPVGLGGQLIDLYEKLVAARSPSVRINGDIALGYKDVNITRNAVTKTLSQWLVDVADVITIMSYRDFALGLDSITFHADHPVTYASTVGKKVYAGIETQFLGDPEKVSFFEEGPAFMGAELAAVRAYYATTSGFGGIAIHDYNNYKIAPFTTPLSANAGAVSPATTTASGAATAAAASGVLASVSAASSGVASVVGSSGGGVASSSGSSSGVASAVASSGFVASAVGSSSGVASVAASSAVRVGAVGTSSGVASVAASSAVRVGAVGTSSGVASVAASSAVRVGAVGSSSGLASVVASSASRVGVVGASSGVASASASSVVVAAVAGASPASSTASATSAFVAGVVGASAASSTALADTYELTGSAFSVAGAATLAGAGASIASAGAVASGVASASGSGASLHSASALSSGAAVVSGVSSRASPSSAVAAAFASVAGVSSRIVSSSASSAGTATASGVAAVTRSGVAASSGSAVVLGVALRFAAASASSLGTAAASGVASLLSTATASAVASAVVSSSTGATAFSTGTSGGFSSAFADSGASTANRVEADALSAASSSASAFSSSAALASASASALATVSGAGRTVAAASGASSSAASASGVGRAFSLAVASSQATSSLAAQSALFVASVAASSGLSSVSGATASGGRADSDAQSAGSSTATSFSARIVSADASSVSFSASVASVAAVRTGQAEASGVSSADSSSTQISSGQGSSESTSLAAAQSVAFLIRSALGAAAGVAQVLGQARLAATPDSLSRVYKVPAEGRRWSVPPDLRSHSIAPENRVLTR